METRKRLTVSSILILAVLFTLALAVRIVLAQETDSKGKNNAQLEPEVVAASVSNVVPIQGRLTNASGNPLTGSYNIHAALYAESSGGTALCSDTDTISVDNGLFNMYLDGSSGCTSGDIDGKRLYLGIKVGSDPEMTPRQSIYPVPYAWSLRPGAEISGTLNSAIVHIENWGTSGRGLRAYAMDTSGENYGVVGASRSPNGIGGYFYNNAGGAGDGVKGEGYYGVHGDGTRAGVLGVSDNADGVIGATNRTDHNYGFNTEDNIHALDFHTSGAQMQVVQNGGATSLETGDVVVFSGIGAPVETDGPPIIQVAGVESANSTAIAGVVYSRYKIEAHTREPEKVVSDFTPEGAAAPGEYLLMVIQGPAKVKCSALAGPLRPGDLLSSASQVGYAAKAAKVTLSGVETALPGTVLGKVLEDLDQGEALIYMFVTLQ